MGFVSKMTAPVRPKPGPPYEKHRGKGEELVARHGKLLQRIFEILPGAFTWLVVSFLFWGPFLVPWPLAALIVLFDIYWFCRSLSAAYHGIKGILKVREASKVNWWQEYEKALDDGKVQIPWEEVHHVVIIPNMNEDMNKLSTTLEHLARQELCPRQITVVLAMEEREKGAVAKALALKREFNGRFAHVFYTLHPSHIPGEVKGKSSNEAWAARWVKKKLVDELGYDLNNMTVTSCDADSLFHSRYFSCLTYKFCTSPNRYRQFWQSPIFLYNNIWEVPMPIRVVSILSSINFLADLCKGHKLVFPQSTYTLSFLMAHEVGYWDAEVIPEDWHMFLKCFFTLGDKVEVEPIFLPTGSDAVRSSTYFQSLVSRYKQAKRHAWGAIDIPYAVQGSLAHPEIPFWTRLRRLWALMENHLVWSTHWFLLALGGAVPTFLNPALGEAPFGGLPFLVSLILTACLGPFLVILTLDALLKPPPPPSFGKWKVYAMYAQWVLLPITSLFFATLPALDAQTQLMLGKPLEYQVTEKV